jgi:hypothetical protein
MSGTSRDGDEDGEEGVSANPPSYYTDIERDCRRIEEHINLSIGTNWWKWYVSSAIWSNVSTPLNFSITILTALTSGSLLSGDSMKGALVGLNMTTLVLSTINSFFRPHDQLTQCLESLKAWTVMGNKFESRYFEMRQIGDLDEKFAEYRNLLQEMNALENKEDPNRRNFATDVLYMIVRATIINKKEKWLSIY